MIGQTQNQIPRSRTNMGNKTRRNNAVFKNILVSLDGSTHSRKALEIGIGLARAFRSNLSIVSVEEHLSRIPATKSEVEDEKESQD
jgi:nucleotide-binding universal stress UspA family protein